MSPDQPRHIGDTAAPILGGRYKVAAAPDEALLESLYGTVGHPSGWTVFLQRLTDSSFFRHATLSLHDTAIKSGAIGASLGFDPSFVAAYADHFASVNPWLARLEKRPVGAVQLSDAIVPYAELRKTEWYSDFCRPLRFDSAIGLTVQRDGARSMVVSVLGRRADLDRDRHVFDRLRGLAPHLLRVAQLNRQFAGLEARALAAETALDRLLVAMFVIGAAGDVVYLNASAERIVAAGDGLTLARGMLGAAVPGESRALRHLVATATRACQAIAAPPGGVLRISRRSGRAPYEVLVAPFPGAMNRLGFGGAMAAVFVRDPAARAVAPLDALRCLYSLTNAEARLMQALLSGDRLDSIAERFGIARETARSHLKAVCSKTGTSSQLELLRLGLRGLAAVAR